MPTTHLLYLHGFRSSPQSFKARLLAQYVAQHHPQVQWWCPQLPASPAQAMAQVLAGVADWPASSMAVVGSSLGGYYASYVAQHKGCKSVLLNPAVAPADTLAQYIDSSQPQWHQPEEAIFFRAQYIDELRALSVRDVPPGGAELGIFCTGDEVLDWHAMVQRYAAAQQVVVQGGDHALSGFEAVLPQVVEFLALV